MFLPGSAFINKATPTISSHLWIVISDPGQDSEHILMVNVTSIKFGRDVDVACVLRIGDHPFIHSDSYIYYEKMKMVNAQNLQELLDTGKLVIQQNVTEDLLIRLRKGLMRSSHSKQKHKDLLSNQGLSQP